MINFLYPFIFDSGMGEGKLCYIPLDGYLLQKLNFRYRNQKTCKFRYQTFISLSNFTRFLYFVSNILSVIAVYCHISYMFLDATTFSLLKLQMICLNEYIIPRMSNTFSLKKLSSVSSYGEIKH